MPQSSTLRRYGVAFLAVAVATLVRSSFNQVLGVRFPLLLHAFAIAVAAQYGGTIPGLVAAALGVLVTLFLYVPPIYSFRISDPSDLLALSAFSIVGIAFSLFGGRRIALLTRLQLYQRVGAACRRGGDRAGCCASRHLGFKRSPLPKDYGQSDGEPVLRGWSRGECLCWPIRAHRIQSNT